MAITVESGDAAGYGHLPDATLPPTVMSAEMAMPQAPALRLFWEHIPLHIYIYRPYLWTYMVGYIYIYIYIISHIYIYGHVWYLRFRFLKWPLGKGENTRIGCSKPVHLNPFAQILNTPRNHGPFRESFTYFGPFRGSV